MRGGTSKAVFLRGEALPQDPTGRDSVILSLFGSPDPRQVDGLGGADLLTSKLAIIDPPSRPDADLDYTFAQVSITEPVVDYDINCGNISAAVGAYAIDEGLVEATEPTTRIRIHNTNTGRI
ncbi:MAG: PrpF domain-containing protein, partial [Acidimicrobiia bacterium]